MEADIELQVSQISTRRCTTSVLLLSVTIHGPVYMFNHIVCHVTSPPALTRLDPNEILQLLRNSGIERKPKIY